MEETGYFDSVLRTVVGGTTIGTKGYKLHLESQGIAFGGERSVVRHKEGIIGS